MKYLRYRYPPRMGEAGFEMIVLAENEIEGRKYAIKLAVDNHGDLIPETGLERGRLIVVTEREVGDVTGGKYSKVFLEAWPIPPLRRGPGRPPKEAPRG